MNKSRSKTKIEIKDWFIVQRIRILNFIKEHKYISVGIFAFLFAALIGFIVYASDGSDTVVSTAEAYRVVLEGEDVEKAESFSEVVYELKYKIDLADQTEGEEITQENKTIIVDASFSEQTDAEWILYEEENVNFYIDEENGNLTAEIYDVITGSDNTLKLHLYLKNIAPETEFAPIFTIYDKMYQNKENRDTDNHSRQISPETIIIESKEITLSSKLIGGEAYKSNDFNGRYAPFGIILGFNKDEYESMRGLYFNPEQKVILSAIQSYEYDEEIIEEELSLDNIENYDIYDKNVKGLNIRELSNVFDSGETLEITKINEDEFVDEDDEFVDDENTELEEDIENEEEINEDEYLSESTNLYELGIRNIKSNGQLYINYIDEEEFITLGTYYIVLNSERQEDNEEEIEVMLTSYDIDYNEESIAYVLNPLSQEGTIDYDFTINKQLKEEITPISSDDYLTYGDEVILNLEYDYGSSWDEDLDELYIRVDLQDDNQIPLELLNYSQASLFNVTTGYEDKTKIVAYKTSEIEELLEEELVSLDGINNIEYLVFKIENITPGSKIKIGLKAQVSSKINTSIVSLTSGIIGDDYEYDYEENVDFIKNLSFNITPFRASTIVYAGNKNYDINIDEKTNETTFSIYPSVELPALKLESTLLESPYVDVLIHITIPDKVNYVENMQYLLPQISGNTLTYVLEKQLINERMEPIYVDVNYDVDIENPSALEVKVVIEAVSSIDPQIKDTTPIEKRTTIRTINYSSSASIIGSITSNKNSISKDESFDVITKLYNNSQNKTSLGLVTLLPYNENMSSNELSYIGSYTFEIPEKAVCTNTMPSNIKSSELLLQVEWKDCSEFDEDEITAIKTQVELSPKEIYEQTIEINPIGNEANNVYKLNSFVILNESQVNTIGQKSVSVFSKKISGIVWEDFNDNGIMDQDESKISDVILKLYNSSDELINETTSNNKGEYTFVDIQEGSYYIIAEFNKDKYSTTVRVTDSELSKTSLFTQISSEQDDESLLNKATTDIMEINENTKTIENCNLGLSLKKLYTIKMKKSISKIVTTNKLGVSETKDYGKDTSFVKLDVKDINNLKIKVVYLIEVENTGYYPGYIREIKDYIPDGMTFNESYEENKDWIKIEGNSEYIVNNSLSDKLIKAGEKQYLTVAFDISRKEAGSFINYAEILDEDLEIFKINKNDIIKGGN